MMTKILCTILSIIGILNSVYAENTTVLYLPHKITSSSLNYIIEYDSLNRIIKEDTAILEYTIDNSTPLETMSFIYNAEGLIEQKRTVRFATPEDKKLNNPEDDFIDYYHYTTNDTLVTANIERRYTTLENRNISLVDSLSILSYLNSSKQVYKINEKSFRISTITEIGYDASSNIESL